MLLCLLLRANIVGGAHTVDPSSDVVIAAFKQTVDVYNSLHGSNLELVTVLSATQKVVAGFIFSGLIKVSNEGVIEHYSVSVWQRPGGDDHQIEKFEKL
jgi:hypothetical protein